MSRSINAQLMVIFKKKIACTRKRQEKKVARISIYLKMNKNAIISKHPVCYACRLPSCDKCAPARFRFAFIHSFAFTYASLTFVEHFLRSWNESSKPHVFRARASAHVLRQSREIPDITGINGPLMKHAILWLPAKFSENVHNWLLSDFR